MAAVVLFVRSQWRRHWRSYLVVAGVAALVTMVVLSAVAGARRSPGAFDRLRERSNAADVAVITFADVAPDAERLARIAAVDGVAEVAWLQEMFVRPAGSDLFPTYDLVVLAGEIDPSVAVSGALVIEGRRPDPTRVDEVAISEKLADELGLVVGDTVPLESFSEKELARADDAGGFAVPDGPTLHVTVVGIVRSPSDFGRYRGVLRLTPAFADRYGSAIRTWGHVEIRLDDSQLVDDPVRLDSFTEAIGVLVSDLSGGDHEFTASYFADRGQTNDGLETVASALWIVGAIAAVAGLMALVLLLSRTSSLVVAEQHVMAALGWTRRRNAIAVAAVIAPAMGAGALLGAALSLWAAPRALVGLAGRADPDHGAIRFDGIVVVGGGVFAAALGCVVAVAVGALSTRSKRSGLRRSGGRALVGMGRPLAVRLGVRRVLASDRSPDRRSNRAAAVAVAVAAAGAVAALTVAASIVRLQHDPRLVGGSDQRALGGEAIGTFDRVLPLLERDDRVQDLAAIHIVFAFGPTARPGTDVSAVVFDVIRGHLDTSILSGRLPQQTDEVAFGPATLDDLGVEVGDETELAADGRTASYRIVGEMLFPTGDFEHDRGIAMTVGAAARLVGDVRDVDGVHQIVFQWAPAVDAGAADQELANLGIAIFTNGSAVLPGSVINLGDVAGLPRWMALFLATLALAALAHALATTRRSAGRELAVLRALGLRRRDALVTIHVQAVSIIVLGLVVGCPVGLVLGRLVWAPIATQANVIVDTIWPGGQIAIAAGAMIVTASVTALLPAWRAARASLDLALRVE